MTTCCDIVFFHNGPRRQTKFFPFGYQHQSISIQNRIIHVACIVYGFADRLLHSFAAAGIIGPYFAAGFQQFVN